MDLNRIAVVVAKMRADEIAEVLRAVNLFERIGAYDRVIAETWRTALRARAAELREPVTEA